MGPPFCPNPECKLLLDSSERAAGRCPKCGQTFPIAADSPTPEVPQEESAKGSAVRVMAGVGIGAPVGGLTWAATGWFSGAVLMLFIWVVARVAKDHEYRGDFWGDLRNVAWWGGIIFGAMGLLVGAIVGGRVGRKGQPLFLATLRGSWNSFGVLATGIGAILAPFAAASVVSEAGGDSPSNRSA